MLFAANTNSSSSTTASASSPSLSFSPSPSNTSPPHGSNYLTPTEASNHHRTALTSSLSSSTPGTSGSSLHVGGNVANNETNGGNLELSFFQAFQQVAQNMPKIVWNVHPHVKLKLRKRFYPLGVTRLTVGADYDFNTRQANLKWSWKDRIIGARLHVNSDEIALSKSFSVDVQTRLDLRASMDLHTKRTLLSLRVQPFGNVFANTRDPGLIIRQKIPLDNRLAIQFAARVRLPEARFAADSSGPVSLGEGDFMIDLDELNFRFLLQ